MSTKVSTWAEVVGIVVLIISLIFVGIEIRQNTKVAAAQAVLDLNLGFNEQSLILAENAELNQLLLDGGADPSQLSTEQYGTYMAFITVTFNIQESAATFYRNGVVDEEEYASFLAATCRLVSSPGGAKFWESSKDFYNPYFRATIENQC